MKKRKICFPAGAAVLCLVIGLCGCGGQEPAPKQEIELLDPVDTASACEAAARRNLYDAKVLSALVCPETEEYSPETDMSFQAYDVYPGEEVKAGQALLHADTESLDAQIESMEETIRSMEEDFNEQEAETEESLKTARRDREVYEEILGNLEDSEPAQTESQEHVSWASQYKKYDGLYRNADLTVSRLEESLKEREELYELDLAYQEKQLSYLKESRQKNVLTSGKSGVVAALGLQKSENWLGSTIRFLEAGDRVSGETPLAAVGDPETKVLRCEYVNGSTVRSAEQIYAVVNGKRYPVTWQEMDSEEYQRLEERDGKVYSSFLFEEDCPEVEMGSYACIVIVNQSRENVLTVPEDAVKKDENGSFVYVVRGGENIYTPVQCGMKDGVYTEILSGLEEGDQVLTAQAQTAGDDTVKVELGEIGNEFTAEGHLEYPSTEVVTNPVTYGTCYYTECMVSLYQQVKKGEVLLRVRVEADDAELERSKKSLQRERERLEDLKALGEEDNKKAIEAKEKTIAGLEETIASMEADFAVTEITSPIDGIVTNLADYEEDAYLSSGAWLFVVADEARSYCVVSDENGQLTYGNEAAITYTGADGEKHETVGEVVTLNQMSISSDLFSGAALIAVSEEDIGNLAGSSQGNEGSWSRSRFEVTVPIRVMENVPVVPKEAVTLVAGQTYVKVKLENGQIQYRSFLAGGSDGTNYWAVEGLTEGMELCLE